MSSFTESLTGWGLVAWQLFLLAAVAGAWAFPVVYAVWFPWRASGMGRHVMAFSVAVAVALTAYGLRLAFGDFPGRTLLMFVALIGLAVTGWWRLLIAVRVLLRDRRKRHAALVTVR